MIYTGGCGLHHPGRSMDRGNVQVHHFSLCIFLHIPPPALGCLAGLDTCYIFRDISIIIRAGPALLQAAALFGIPHYRAHKHTCRRDGRHRGRCHAVGRIAPLLVSLANRGGRNATLMGEPKMIPPLRIYRQAKILCSWPPFRLGDRLLAWHFFPPSIFYIIHSIFHMQTIGRKCTCTSARPPSIRRGACMS